MNICIYKDKVYKIIEEDDRYIYLMDHDQNDLMLFKSSIKEYKIIRDCIARKHYIVGDASHYNNDPKPLIEIQNNELKREYKQQGYHEFGKNVKIDVDNNQIKIETVVFIEKISTVMI